MSAPPGSVATATDPVSFSGSFDTTRKAFISDVCPDPTARIPIQSSYPLRESIISWLPGTISAMLTGVTSRILPSRVTTAPEGTEVMAMEPVAGGTGLAWPDTLLLRPATMVTGEAGSTRIFFVYSS